MAEASRACCRRRYRQRTKKKKKPTKPQPRPAGCRPHGHGEQQLGTWNNNAVDDASNGSYCCDFQHATRPAHRANHNSFAHSHRYTRTTRRPATTTASSGSAGLEPGSQRTQSGIYGYHQSNEYGYGTTADGNLETVASNLLRGVQSLSLAAAQHRDHLDARGS
jgi:hypothetical protein